MSNTTMTGGEAKRTRRLFLLGVLLLVAAIAITAGRVIHSRMQQARLTQDRRADLQWGTKIYSAATADKAQEKQAKYLAKAQTLRDHWRVWALSHQALLRQLRQAPPGDTATLMRVYAALPTSEHLNQATGVTLADVGMSVEDLTNENVVRFSWQPQPMKAPIPAEWARKDPNAQAMSDRYDDTTLKLLHHSFSTYHSIALSESMSAGRSRITLWADGRITQMTRILHPAMGQRDEGPEKEIVPPYDFLK
jgi:hypothetical protein